MSLPDAKPAIQSRTLVGAAVVLISTGLSAAGIEYDVAALDATLNDVATLIGAGLAIWGRLGASKSISGLIR